MIDGIDGPMDRLVARLRTRWGRWVDSIAADPPAPRSGPEPVVQPVQPAPRGLPAVIAAALQGGKVDGLSQREIARKFNVGKGTVQRAQQLVRELADA
jgi:DNA-directed RNA polymerase specialized sigma24 family protein